MLNRDKFILDIITNICVYFDYDIDSVSSFLNNSVFYHYKHFIVNVCKFGSSLEGFSNESK